MSVRFVTGLRVAVGSVAMFVFVHGAMAVGEEAPPSKSAPAAISTAQDSSTGNAASSNDKRAEPPAKPDTASDSNTREAMCLMIESAARAEGLPLEFFARVIWQESRFQPDAVGPVTRNGKRAQGIAQFMPGTADERRLLDPFDPVQALPKSAEFLNELRGEFGNLGLAAAAYNAGPARVRKWIEGSGSLPDETRNYVLAITGNSADEWAAAKKDGKPLGRPSTANCRELMALLKRAPNPFVAGLERRVKLGADRPWGVQLAAGFSRDRAMATYARAMKRLAGVIGDRDPSLLGSIWRSRGTRTFYQVRIGIDTRAAANDLCERIHRAGQGCLVLRNRKVKG